ncbi:hypothetical protein VTJ04DRAFT_8726 [Mycothermus thermophilus]|uniref:uncharacterized protein n=1 Tax=Humicola insolens TaxID=85995 RepID=UPI0037435B4E
MDSHSNHDQMYCHACHHQWQRVGESIDCPACMSSSTEIIDPEYDPRHFHARRHTNATGPSASEPSQQPTRPAESNTNPAAGVSRPQQHPENATAESQTTTNTTNGAGPQQEWQDSMRFSVRFRTFNWPPVTFFNIVFPATPSAAPTPAQTSTPAPAPAPAPTATPAAAPAPENAAPAQNTTPAQAEASTQNPTTGDNATSAQNTAQVPEPIAFFGLHFIPPFHVVPLFAAPPVHNVASQQQPAPNNNAQPNTQQEQAQQTEQQQDEQQSEAQPQPQPQPRPQRQQPRPIHPLDTIPLPVLANLLASLTTPAAGVIGDAVYSQEAFDRVLAQLRELAPQGGPPPASKQALDRLKAHEMVMDEALIAKFHEPRCVVCVEDMAAGERAAVLPCEHLFHGDCVRPWLELHGTCPVCRRSVEVEEETKEVVKEGSPAPPAAGQGEVQSPATREATAGGEAMDLS